MDKVLAIHKNCGQNITGLLGFGSGLGVFL
jgi:hypothetical protein